MAIVVDDNTPDFLREFLTSQGVISVRDTETGETGVVPIQPRRRPRPNTGGFEGGDFDDPSLPESGNSIVDGAANLFTGLGQLVEDGLGKIGGLFNTDGNNALGAYGGNVPSNIMGRINPAFTDTTISTDRLAGQALGTGLLGASSFAIPNVGLLGMGAKALSSLGFHHDYNPSRDSNLNFDVTSGRFEWDSLDPGGGGVQYGSKPNEQMIVDEANENPNERFNVTWLDEEGNQKTGNISFGEARDVLGMLNDPNFRDDPQAVWDAFTRSGPTFGSQVMFGNTSNQTAMNEFDATGTGAILNEAAAVLGPNAGYEETRDLANTMRDTLAIAPEMFSMYDYNPDEDGIGTDFDADDGMGSMSSMGFGEGDFGTDGII